MSQTRPDPYPPATPHDPPEEVFPDVFLIRGSLQMNPLTRINRNMVVVRSEGELSVINSVRLTEAGEQALRSLGTVRHVLRLGYFHGRDDRYYVDKFSAEFWAPAGSRPEPGPSPTRLIKADGDLPFPGAVAFLFAQSKYPEAAILLPKNDGILLTCDCLQYYTDRRFHSLLARIMLPLMGFPLRMLIGPMWLKAMTPEGGSLLPDFEGIQQLDFEHLIPAHGSVRKGAAKQAAAEAIGHAFPTTGV